VRRRKAATDCLCHGGPPTSASPLRFPQRRALRAPGDHQDPALNAKQPEVPRFGGIGWRVPPLPPGGPLRPAMLTTGDDAATPTSSPPPNRRSRRATAPVPPPPRLTRRLNEATSARPRSRRSEWNPVLVARAGGREPEEPGADTAACAHPHALRPRLPPSQILAAQPSPTRRARDARGARRAMIGGARRGLLASATSISIAAPRILPAAHRPELPRARRLNFTILLDARRSDPPA